ncbi:hypothetical protein BGZ65_009773, partial [Modicella reniformis]
MSATIAASTVLATLGACKVYWSLTAQRGRTLPSLKAVAHTATSSAYPEDYYSGGQYVELSHGETHYFLFGPEDGKKIVFVHGFSVPASVYSSVARQMANNGCRVLLYDLYSRGYTEGPSEDHNSQLYVAQLRELLLHVGWTKCNFGGGIVACYSHQFPEAVQSLTFISPGGLLLHSQIPLVGKIFLTPLTEEIFSQKLFKKIFATKNIESMRKEFKHEASVPEVVEEAAKILALQYSHHAGYARGLMSTLRTFPLAGLGPQFETSQQQSYPVQVIWGTRDTVIPRTTIDTIQQLIPRIKVTIVEGATHSIVMTHPAPIVEQLESFVC